MKHGASALILFATVFLTPPQIGAQNTYTLKDLESLEKDKNYEEFLRHAMDIRPSERLKLWRDMYQSMAMEMIDSKIRDRDFTMENFKKVEELGRSSLLYNDEFFQLKRSVFAKNFFDECYKKSSAPTGQNDKYTYKICDKELGNFWANSKRDPDFGLELAGLIEKYPSTLPTWQLYERAISDKTVAPIYCERPQVQKAVIKKLAQETFSADFNGDYSKLTDRIIPDKCFTKLIPTLKEMTSSPLTNGIEKEMAMNILEAKGKISQADQDLLAIIYLLDGPVVGEKMNISWAKIEKLGENYSKRRELLEKLKSLPTMPDKIFKDPELPRHKAIINLFAKNFPEYLDYYANKCVDLIDTKKEIPANIGSGFQCSQFLKTAQEIKEGTQWMSDSVQSRYSALKKGIK